MSNLTNSTERETAKQDRSGARTASDVIRRIPDIDKIEIKASQIELEGYTSINGGFKIDETGNMECKNASITGGSIVLSSSDTSPTFILKDPTDDKMTTEISGTSIAIYERVWDDPVVKEPKCGFSYSPFGYATGSLYGKESYMNIGTFTLNDNLINPIGLYEHNGGHIELTNNSGSLTIDCNGTTGNIKCVSLTQTSLEEQKKNFEKFDNALDLIKDIDIYKYNMKNEANDDKKHIGFVIGDNYKYRREITDKQNKGVDLYSFISVCCKAIQEQQEEIEELRKLVKNDKN